jgi:Dynamin central region
MYCFQHEQSVVADIAAPVLYLYMHLCVYMYAYQQCADLVFDEMQRIAAQCESTELSRFPALKERVVEVVHGKLIHF